MLKPLVIRFWGIKITIGADKLRAVASDFVLNVIDWEKVKEVIRKAGLPEDQAAEARDKLKSYLLGLLNQ